jgi:hypothetical protein
LWSKFPTRPRRRRAESAIAPFSAAGSTDASRQPLERRGQLRVPTSFAIRNVKPDPDLFPDFDENLRNGLRQETELFIDSQLRDNRSIVELLTANYTFMNERLARHYAIPDVYGDRFRRVTFPDDRRGGLLGQASLLTVTSYPNRTSPVLRGKWLLENILGTPPPAPPPHLTAFKDRGANGERQSARKRLQ